MKNKAEFTGMFIWVNNLIDQKWWISSQDLEKRFNSFLSKKEKSWIEYYWLDGVIREFMTAKDAPACSSTFEESDYPALYDFLKPIAEKFMDSKTLVGS